MNNKFFKKKINIALLATILSLPVNLIINNNAYAVSNNSFDLSNTFCERIAYGDPLSYNTVDGNDYMTYIVYSPTTVAAGSYRGSEFKQYGTIQAGQFYVITTIDGDVHFEDGKLVGLPNDDSRIISMGNAEDIFGAGLSD